MAKHEIDFIDEREKGLAHVVDVANKQLPVTDPPTEPFTTDTYLQFVMDSAADSWTKQAGVAETVTINDALTKATPEEVEQVKAILKLTK